jgi:hypothetical protein
MPLRLPQIPHGLTWAWTQTSAVRGQWLTAWAMTQPVSVVSRLVWHLVSEKGHFGKQFEKEVILNYRYCKHPVKITEENFWGGTK